MNANGVMVKRILAGASLLILSRGTAASSEGGRSAEAAEALRSQPSVNCVLPDRESLSRQQEENVDSYISWMERIDKLPPADKQSVMRTFGKGFAKHIQAYHIVEHATVWDCSAAEKYSRLVKEGDVDVNAAFNKVALSEIADKEVYIVNRWLCEQGERRCGYHLSFTGTQGQLYPPEDTVGLVPWKLVRVPGTNDEFYIYNRWRCGQGDERCGMHLSFNGTRIELFPASDTYNRVPWKLALVPGTKNRFNIRNRWRCSASEPRCGMHLTYTGTTMELYPRDNTYDLVPWEIMVVGAQ